MISHSTFYNVETLSWFNPGSGQSPYWRAAGYGPGGKTLEEAYKKVRVEIKRITDAGHDLSKVKFKITKTVQTVTVEDEMTGSDFTALALKLLD